MEELVNFETARLAKKRGFQFGCSTIFVQYHKSYKYDGDASHPESHKKGEIREQNDSYMMNNSHMDLSNDYYTLYERPTIYQLATWFRVQHKIIIEINSVCVGDQEIIQYKYTIIKHTEVGNHLTELTKEYYFNTYEEALYKGLISAFNYI